MSRLPHLQGRGPFLQQQANQNTQPSLQPPTQPPMQPFQNNLSQQQFPGRQEINQQQTPTQQYQPQPQFNQHTQAQNIQPQQSQQMQQAQKSKINIDQIPRPILTPQDSLNPKLHLSNSSVMQAPPSYSYFVQKDNGSAGPKYIRPSIYAFGTEPNFLSSTGVPQGCIISPFADGDEAVQIVDCSLPNTTMLRCSRCHGYINPYFLFTEGGNSVVCNLCRQVNKVPNEYFAPINELQERSDKQARPELCKGVYEFVAPSNYPRKEIKQNLIMICLEMTPTAVNSGVFVQALHTIRSSLDAFPVPERTAISLCTYSSQLNYYSIPKDLSNDPQLIVVADLEDPYCPFPINALFLNVVNDREKLEYLIEKLLNNGENMLQNTPQNQFYVKTASIGAVIQSIYTMLEENPARVIAFTSQLPQVGFGKLKKRDDPKIMGTEQEKSLYAPQSDLYKQLGQDLLKKSISVDLFVFSPEYCDLATISTLSTQTGGSLYYYPHYNSSYDGEKVHYQLFRNLTKNYGQDCIMTLRASPGIILEEFFTGKGKVSVRDLQLSALDQDQTIGIQYKQEEKVQGNEAFLQYAILYTNLYGQRVIRVINLAVQVQNSVQNVFKYVDLEGTTGMMFRKILSNMQTHTTKQLVEQFVQQIVTILYAYRTHCAQGTQSGQLVLPETLKMLPLMIQSLFKQELLRYTSQTKADQKTYEAIKLFTLNFYSLNQWLYPKVYPIHNIDNEYHDQQAVGTINNQERVLMPGNIPSSVDKLNWNGIYLIDNGEVIYLYILKDASMELIENLLGVQEYEQIKGVLQFPNFPENEYSVKVNNIVDQLRKNKNGAYQSVHVVSYKDTYEQEIKNILVEDEIKGQKSYADFLCYIYQQISNKYMS